MTPEPPTDNIGCQTGHMRRRTDYLKQSAAVICDNCGCDKTSIDGELLICRRCDKVLKELGRGRDPWK